MASGSCCPSPVDHGSLRCAGTGVEKGRGLAKDHTSGERRPAKSCCRGRGSGREVIIRRRIQRVADGDTPIPAPRGNVAFRRSGGSSVVRCGATRAADDLGRADVAALRSRCPWLLGWSWFTRRPRSATRGWGAGPAILRSGSVRVEVGAALRATRAVRIVAPGPAARHPPHARRRLRGKGVRIETIGHFSMVAAHRRRGPPPDVAVYVEALPLVGQRLADGVGAPPRV